MSRQTASKKGKREEAPPPPPPKKDEEDEEEEFQDELQPMDFITLLSNDGYKFIVDKRTAMVSITLRNMMYGGANYEEAKTKTFRFNNIRANILEKIIEYWHYKSQYSNHADQLPEFKIDPEISVELLNCAEYLQT